MGSAIMRKPETTKSAAEMRTGDLFPEGPPEVAIKAEGEDETGEGDGRRWGEREEWVRRGKERKDDATGVNPTVLTTGRRRE